MSILRNRCDGRKPFSVSAHLESARSRWLFALLILTIVAGYCWETVRVYMAAEYAASAKPELWRRAAQWEPGNADYWAQLGSMEAWDFGSGDLEQAAKDYERALAANPCSDHDWLELAGIYERRGQASRARNAYEKAHFCRPLSALVARRYGSFLLRQEEYSLAYAELRRALLTDPAMTGAGVLECWGARQDATAILDQVVPPRKQHLLLAMDVFLSQKHLDAALDSWERLVATGEPIETSASIRLMDDLIRAERITEAEQVWKEALRAAGWPGKVYAEKSLVFDGGFEQILAQGGFGWRTFPLEGASIETDREVAHSGRISLRVTFDGSRNLDFRNVVQYVPADPLRWYQFSAFLRTQDISTESGLQFEVLDFHNGSALDVMTETFTGTSPWTRVHVEFKTGRATKLLAIILRRVPSEKIDNKLRGTVWVDDVQLREKNDPVGDEQR